MNDANATYYDIPLTEPQIGLLLEGLNHLPHGKVRQTFDHLITRLQVAMEIERKRRATSAEAGRRVQRHPMDARPDPRPTPDATPIATGEANVQL